MEYKSELKKYIIRWNYGYGDMFLEVEAIDSNDATMIAYEYWREDVENNADYECLGLSTEELRREYLD